jgi:hypothetical protein
VAVLLLEEIQLLDAAVDVVRAGVIPGARWIVFLKVRVGVCQVDFAGLGADVGKGVKDVG